MPLTLGATPELLTVYLTAGAALHVTLQATTPDGSPSPWPAGATLSLQLVYPGAGVDTSWPFTIAGPTATLTVAAADVTALPRYPLGARLWLDYADGNGPFLWCSGRVTWNA